MALESVETVTPIRLVHAVEGPSRDFPQFHSEVKPFVNDSGPKV